jgi:25S rRNA (uracil2634-N3)-methyltransferase
MARKDNRENGMKESMRTLHIWRDGKRTKTSFRMGQKVLLVGEGNFSFAVSLVKQISDQSGEMMETCGDFLVATCYDSEDILYQKYGKEAVTNIQFLQSVGATVLFSIDATQLGKYKEIRNHKTFHRIVFHFPHVGKQ